MILKRLSLVNYKNFDSKSFDFDSKINCFVGPNGIGKTNVLDAIYHLSFGKSYFNPVASQNIKHDEDFFVIDGIYDKDDANSDFSKVRTLFRFPSGFVACHIPCYILLLKTKNYIYKGMKEDIIISLSDQACAHYWV